MNPHPPTRLLRRGVTLLELILALALAVVVLAAIGWAIQLHMRSLDTRRSDVEESQLARAVLKIIADDLRSVVAYNAVDFREAANLAVGGPPDLGEFNEDEFDDEPEPEDEEGEDGMEGEEEEEPRDLSDDITPSTVPGIYGNQYQLQMDVSHLPRIEDFATVVRDAAGQVRDLPSDVKTVAYYLQSQAITTNQSNSGARMGTLNQTSPVGSANSAGQGVGQGLVRRSLDRAATSWAMQNSDFSRLDRNGELLAPEVVAMEFRYFDGATWHAEWDTQKNGGLPMAVEIGIAIAQTRSDTSVAEAAAPTTLLDGQQSGKTHVYHQVIRIPSAEPTFDELQAIETDVE